MAIKRKKKKVVKKSTAKKKVVRKKKKKPAPKAQQFEEEFPVDEEQVAIDMPEETNEDGFPAEGEEPKAFSMMIAPPSYNLTEMTRIGACLRIELKAYYLKKAQANRR